MLRSSVKVGLVTCWYRNASMENYSRNLKTMLERLRIKVVVISSHCICRSRFPTNIDPSSDCRFASFPYIYEVMGSNFFALLARFFLLLLRGVNYLSKGLECDVIHYQQSNYYSFGIVPLLPFLLAPIGQKIVVTIHNFDKMQQKCRFLNWVYRRAHCVIVHSRDMKQKAARLGIPRERLVVLFHGATATPSVRRRPRTEITFLGAPERRKGFFVLIKALSLLKKRKKSPVVHVYGIYNKKEKDRAKREAQKLGVEEFIVWGGRLSEEEFDQKLQGSLFTIAPFVTSVSGSSVVTRAMAHGTPTISTAVGGVPEYLDAAGVIVPPNNVQLLADAIVSLASNERLREELGNKARKRAAKLFSWNRISRETLKIYRDVLDEK